MSSDSRFVSESLEALLVSIAEGAREAQDAMSSAPSVDAFGRPMATYHMPELDFKVEVNMETVANAGKSGGLFLRILKRQGESSTRDISSTLSGRLVAIPPGDGLPSLVLNISSVRESARRHRIKITAMNSAGEILTGQSIELNINKLASKQLSQAAGVTLNTLRQGTRLNDVVLITDAQGKTETVLNIDAGISTKAVIVVTAEIGGENASLSVSAGGIA